MYYIYYFREQMRLPVTLSTIQKEGVESLSLHKASILADPPGAGKTWTTLATIVRDADKLARCLVVGPNQVLHQWVGEMEKIGELN